MYLHAGNNSFNLSSRSPSGDTDHETREDNKRETEMKGNNITEEDIDEIESFEREEQRIQEEVERQVNLQNWKF